MGGMTSVVSLAVLFLVFVALREFWCWFFKLTAIYKELNSGLPQELLLLREEVQRTNSILQMVLSELAKTKE